MTFSSTIEFLQLHYYCSRNQCTDIDLIFQRIALPGGMRAQSGQRFCCLPNLRGRFQRCFFCLHRLRNRFRYHLFRLHGLSGRFWQRFCCLPRLRGRFPRYFFCLPRPRGRLCCSAAFQQLSRRSTFKNKLMRSRQSLLVQRFAAL